MCVYVHTMEGLFWRTRLMNTRKNLMVDSRKIHRLATRLGTSESEAVRRAVEVLLARPSVGLPGGLTLRGLTDLLRSAPDHR